MAGRTCEDGRVEPLLRSNGSIGESTNLSSGLSVLVFVERREGRPAEVVVVVTVPGASDCHPDACASVLRGGALCMTSTSLLSSVVNALVCPDAHGGDEPAHARCATTALPGRSSSARRGHVSWRSALNSNQILVRSRPITTISVWTHLHALPRTEQSSVSARSFCAARRRAHPVPR